MKTLKNTAVLLLLSAAFLVFLAKPLLAETGENAVYSKLPVKEVTIFKDGHAYVLHEGLADTNKNGDVVLDFLPNPVLGTFWAYSAEAENKLACVIASRENIEQTEMDFELLLRKNLNKTIEIREKNKDQSYQGTLIKVLSEYPVQWHPESGRKGILDKTRVSQKILIQSEQETRAIDLDRIETISFLADMETISEQTQTKDLMTLRLDWGKNNIRKKTAMGMAYVQKGIRWIPNYCVEIDGKGNAHIKLQATIINELADLDDVKAHLVIGVPRFAFAHTADPISLQDTLAQLSGYFNADSSMGSSLSNAICTQARFTEMPAVQRGNDVSLPELDQTQGREDLFVFSLDHINLKKGQRMVLPIAEYTLPYEDLYVVDLPFSPPMELRRNFNTQQHLQLAKLFHAPKAMHTIRLENTSRYPLTTAPATIFKGQTILAQGMMQYTAIGAKGNLEITNAVNIDVKKTDTQVNQIPNAQNWNGNSYSKVEMLGTIELTNYSDKAVQIQVNRSVLGNLDQASDNGDIRQLGHGYDGLVFDDGLPFWWNWCSWPWWWYHFNSIGQANWTVRLEPAETIKLNYNWHYYWQ